MRLAFPEDVETAQTSWPEDSPLSEAALRAELLDLAAEIVKLTARTRKIYNRLPGPSELQLGDPDDLPESLYFTLHSALSVLFEEGLEGSKRVIEDALAATPESLRRSWLKRQLADPQLEPLIPEAS